MIRPVVDGGHAWFVCYLCCLVGDVPGHAADGSVDLLRHFTGPLPIEVICELIGIAEPDRPRWQEYRTAVAAGWGQIPHGDPGHHGAPGAWRRCP